MNNQTLLTELEQVVQQELAAARFPGTAKISEIDTTPSFQACIDTASFTTIDIKVNSQFEEKNPQQTKVVIKDVARHEINHRGYAGFHGCPRELELHTKNILEPIAEVLNPKGYSLSDAHYLANALEDSVLHDDLNAQFCLDGISRFFQEVGEHSDKQSFTPFYEAHVRLNMYLWGNKQQRKKLATFYTQNKKDSPATQVIQNFLKRTQLGELESRKDIRDFLNDENNWPEISKIYAEEFSKLMQPGYAQPLFNHSGKGTQGNKEQPAAPQDIPSEGNPFDREMYSPGNKKKRINDAYYDDENVPPWMTQFEALDILYQSLAQKLEIKVETFTKQSSFPVVHYGRKEFDPEVESPKRVIFGFDDKGELTLQKRRYHEDIPLEYKVKPKGFPEVRFCLLDTSGSMKESPNSQSVGRTNLIPWGDNSKYHYALLGWYGLLEYLKENHLLNQTGISLGNFSTRTTVAQGLMEAKKLALSPQFGGNTVLDLEAVKHLFRDQGMLMFTLSDGEIANWNGIKEEFASLAHKHHYFHVQIGPKNETTHYLEQQGLKVVYVRGQEDLANKIIDVTDKLYRGQT